MNSVAIVGAGVAGITTAYFLAKNGYKVRVYDYNGIASQCSYANGGQLSVCNAEVWNTYSNIVKGIKWLTHSDAPLAFRPDHWSWAKIKWLAGFIGSTIINSYDRNTRKTIEYSLRSRELMKELIDELNINFHQKDCGILHIYKNEKSWNKAKKTLDRFKDTGWGRIKVCPDVSKYNIKNKNIIGATFTKEDSVGDIFTFCNELSKLLQKKYDYKVITKKVTIDDITNFKQKYNEVVICAGAYTSKLVPSLNIYPVKGYSITYYNEKNIPTVSVLDDDKKIVASSFSNNVFRVAGTAELAGWNHTVRQDRIQPLIDWTTTNTYIEDKDGYKKWACLRPMTPNMLPIITKVKGLWINSGAGHLGWTMGMALAEQLVNRRMRHA